MVRQKVPKLYFQSQFSMTKIDALFSKKKKTFKNFRKPFFVKIPSIFDIEN